jgi:hypothetical protein
MGTNLFNLDTTAVNNVTFDSIGIQGTNVVSNFDDALRAVLASTKSHMLDIGGANTVGGTADAITITPASGTIDALYDGLMIGVRIASDNTLTTTTLAVGGTAATIVKKSVLGVETTIAAGDLLGGAYGFFVYRSAWASAAGAWEWCPQGFNVLGFDAADFATAAQGATADTAVQPSTSPILSTANMTDAVDKRFMTDAQETVLDSVETNADVTDTANVTTAGALMDSEVTNLAQVKAFNSADYATAAQGATADSAMQDLADDTTPQLGSALDGQGNDLNNLGVVFLTEQAAAEIDVAGKGQFWVKDSTPNIPYFTDDAGNDGQIHTSTAHGTFFGDAGTTTEAVALEVGINRTGNGFAYIDLIGDATYTDYGLRIIRGSTGANTSSSLTHRGTGAFDLVADEAANIAIWTDSTNRFQVGSTGNIDCYGDVYMNANDIYLEGGYIYGADTDESIQMTADNVKIFAGTAEQVNFSTLGTFQSAPFYIAERAAAASDWAANGQLWVKNTTPCQLWFTDDTGTDTQIV